MRRVGGGATRGIRTCILDCHRAIKRSNILSQMSGMQNTIFRFNCTKRSVVRASTIEMVDRCTWQLPRRWIKTCTKQAEDLYQEFGIKHVQTVPHSLWENGFSERVIQTVNQSSRMQHSAAVKGNCSELHSTRI